jgi:RNA-binding protein YhbY
MGVEEPMELRKLKAAILKELSDGYLHSIAEIAEALDAKRVDVRAALIELWREEEVGRQRRRWCR